MDNFIKHFARWFSISGTIVLSLCLFKINSKLNNYRQDLDRLKANVTVINVPVTKDGKETIEQYFAFGVASMDKEFPGILPIFMREDNYETWRNKTRVAYIREMEKRKNESKTTNS